MRQVSILVFLLTAIASFGQNTFQSFEDIQTKAVEEEKPILMVFSGSDWCKPCMHLKKHVLDSRPFIEESEHFIFLYLDFPYKKKNKPSKEIIKRNEDLAEVYNKSGHFPHVVLIDAHGNELTTVAYYTAMTTDLFTSKLSPHYDK